MSGTIRPPAVDPETLPVHEGTNYPAALAGPCQARRKRALGDAVGLTHFGVNLVELPPGTWSSLRHWHANEDEFIYVLKGEITLVTEGGEQVLRPGSAAGFPAGRPDGHHLINRGTATAVYLEVGDRSGNETVDYPDSDMRLVRHGTERRRTRRNGEPLPNDR
jgi:uncharacterized cupin superfamily protein